MMWYRVLYLRLVGSSLILFLKMSECSMCIVLLNVFTPIGDTLTYCMGMDRQSPHIVCIPRSGLPRVPHGHGQPPRIVRIPCLSSSLPDTPQGHG